MAFPVVKTTKVVAHPVWTRNIRKYPEKWPKTHLKWNFTEPMDSLDFAMFRFFNSNVNFEKKRKETRFHMKHQINRCSTILQRFWVIFSIWAAEFLDISYYLCALAFSYFLYFGLRWVEKCFFFSKLLLLWRKLIHANCSKYQLEYNLCRVPSIGLISIFSAHQLLHLFK